MSAYCKPELFDRSHGEESLRELCALQCSVVLYMVGLSPEWESCHAWRVKERCVVGQDPHPFGFDTSVLMGQHTLLRPERWNEIDVRSNLEQLLLPHLCHTLTMEDNRLRVLGVDVDSRIVRTLGRTAVQVLYQVRMGTVAPPQQGYTIALQQVPGGQYTRPTLA